MKIAAYQFAVSGCMEDNYNMMKAAAAKAAREHVRLLVFPECALTGYPPYDMERASCVDFKKASLYQKELQRLAGTFDMYIVAGAVTCQEGKIYDSAILIRPEGGLALYHKRALWGWDLDNFQSGNEQGVFEIDGIKIGIRICYEVRFPEYFRELYVRHTDLDIILFYDRSDQDDLVRYNIIRSHILTRGVENVCHVLTVNTIHPYQTAPTALFDPSGLALGELERNIPGMLCCELDDFSYNFGEEGRRRISDRLIKEKGSNKFGSKLPNLP